MEKFSVLMSVYHREKGTFLRTALESVFNQTAPPNEVVVVKDGPLTDELDAVIEEFQKQYYTLKVIALPKNVGLGEALNQGLKHCTYELVARMDSDDICVNNRFELQLKACESNPKADIVGGWISEFENDITQIISYRKLPETNEELKHFFCSKNPFNHMTVMFRKSNVIQAGGYQHFYLMEDYWLWARMIHNGAQLYNIQNVLVNVRGGNAMAARRGGGGYAMTEIKFFKNLHKMKLISYGSMLKNITIRVPVRLLPNKIRTFVYKKLLR